MSLKEFHIVFITASVLLSLALAYWGVAQSHHLHDRIYIGTSLLSLVAAIGLMIYEIRFIQKTRMYHDR